MKLPSIFTANKLKLVLSAALLTQTALAQEVPVPQDQPYPGTVQLDVNITNVEQKIFSMHEVIPAQPGRLTLLYPKWIPGNHSPTGPIALLAGLKLTANGQPLEWQRDTLDMYAFHVQVPAGATQIEASYQFLSPIDHAQGRITATSEMLGIQWNTVVLYPAGFYARDIQFQPSVTLPNGWKFASALETQQQNGNRITFKSLALDELADSPLMAGRHFKRYDLDPGAKVPVYLNVFADNDKDLEAKPEQLAAHQSLVQQAYKLYGSKHYGHYDFLLALSDEFTDIGLEHHQSSENGVKPNYFSEWDKSQPARDLLPHEYTHSWNGKFRRPADLWTPNYNVPMQNSLLWVYEGQTEYWGFILAARSGILSRDDVIDYFALTAASFNLISGRSWRSLQDTTNQPVLNYHQIGSWGTWQRAVDYYDEGSLIWLDVDTKIRELSDGKRSLNDFAQQFLSVNNGSHVVLPYQFSDVADTLNAVQKYDWAAFLRQRLDSHGPGAPLEGLARAGWKLVFTEQPSDYEKLTDDAGEVSDFSYSLGFTLNKDAHLMNVVWDSPAFNAQLSTGMTLMAVNGVSYKADGLKAAITAAKAGTKAIELLFKKNERYLTVRMNYHDGLKYPHLVRIAGTKDLLGEILQPL